MELTRELLETAAKVLGEMHSVWDDFARYQGGYDGLRYFEVTEDDFVRVYHGEDDDDDLIPLSFVLVDHKTRKRLSEEAHEAAQNERMRLKVLAKSQADLAIKNQEIVQLHSLMRKYPEEMK
jgi:hypothetical protein